MNRLVNTILAVLFLSGISYAQVFHFVNTSTTMIKNTSQTPVHWYIEIYNDLNVDDTLRWKAHFVNVPPQWDINFDTQSGYWHPVLDGDSADFLLMDSMSFPQKLIIGNATNNTPGHGSVFFDIYDPQNPTDLVTIEYEFIITLAAAEVEEQLPENLIQIGFDQIYFYCSQSYDYSIVSINGQTLRKGNTHNGSCMISDLASGMYFIYLQSGDKRVTKKFRK